MIFRKLLVGAAWLLLAPLAHAALTIEIVGSGANQIPISVVPFAGENALPQGITAVIAADLQRSGLFKIVDPAGVRPEPHELAEVNYPDWRTRGADALAVGSALPRSDGKLEVRFRLLDAVKQAQLDAYSYVIDRAQTRATAHKIADLIYEKLTGDVGVFSTRIAYIVKSRSHYELQVADADGYGAQTVLASKEPIISPSWSPNGAKLAYVSFERKKPIIYVQSLVSSQRQVLAQFKGNNSAPAWSPDGKQLAIVLTKDGSSQIYLINADGSGVKRLSYSSGIDTEPSFSPDGAAIIFTSDRGGSPQIYRMSVSGSGAQRLTFEGNYNVSPRFSPDGKSFTFIQRVSGSSFHVALQDLASGQMQVLTDTRMDEAPSFAPNGKMLLYATEIGGRGVLAAVSSDGRVKQRLSTQAGDVREPEWGPLLKN
ncbi:MAG: Tol-Pal system beta propeller repeat protein TolB [Betaproteobacteria bacterium CG2_30_59_46]|nr:MAG: Tol-Pal system beta propeller repeat protein TolB [Betaproteobacteria bacterium CG2_30_59_46]PIQ12486.1 MAG: Tol-Pal system beta propeller repeat protein TolB [Hydrogenophilales bacterium CG18_big_fil_WC_8_21_14_2_50_58_12]PIY00030.1 MAG: Tol-Pal system beta propeller repeat protein TolB [Hydrogenophilales bacterium CG_4_10_14_3_um_filter_58_23]PJB08868.1 MAG: Tol-Pal system beta propeller repeat protein TolB [Hydrogenophilales bacterium CG_4_9_14_3_um_filter_59_35]